MSTTLPHIYEHVHIVWAPQLVYQHQRLSRYATVWLIERDIQENFKFVCVMSY